MAPTCVLLICPPHLAWVTILIRPTRDTWPLELSLHMASTHMFIQAPSHPQAFTRHRCSWIGSSEIFIWRPPIFRLSWSLPTWVITHYAICNTHLLLNCALWHYLLHIIVFYACPCLNAQETFDLWGPAQCMCLEKLRPHTLYCGWFESESQSKFVACQHLTESPSPYFLFSPLSYSLILAALDTHQLFHPSPQLHWESARTAPLQWQLHGSISVWSEGHCSRKQTTTKPQEADRCKYLMSLIACVLLLVSNCSRCYWLQSTLYWTQYRTHSTTHKHLVVVCMYKKCWGYVEDNTDCNIMCHEYSGLDHNQWE